MLGQPQLSSSLLPRPGAGLPQPWVQQDATCAGQGRASELDDWRALALGGGQGLGGAAWGVCPQELR
eukprot:10577679-Alexandrium_andersonii.AAC.1